MNLDVSISVVIPCYKHGDKIERALKSIQDQTLQPLEVIIVDDASPDQSVTQIQTILSALNLPSPQLIVRKQNGGPGLARNDGWNAAKGTWVAFLDADDIWHPQKLERQAMLLHHYPQADLVAHATELFQAKSFEKTYSSQTVPITTPISMTDMLIRNHLPTRSVMLRRLTAVQFSSRRLSEDYELWLKLLARGQHIIKSQEVLAFSLRPECSPGGLSGNLWRHGYAELSVFYRLTQQGEIQAYQGLLAIIWSSIKLARRLALRFIGCNP